MDMLDNCGSPPPFWKHNGWTPGGGLRGGGGGQTSQLRPQGDTTLPHRQDTFKVKGSERS